MSAQGKRPSVHCLLYILIYRVSTDICTDPLKSSITFYKIIIFQNGFRRTVAEWFFYRKNQTCHIKNSQIKSLRTKVSQRRARFEKRNLCGPQKIADLPPVKHRIETVSNDNSSKVWWTGTFEMYIAKKLWPMGRFTSVFDVFSSKIKSIGKTVWHYTSLVTWWWVNC